MRKKSKQKLDDKTRAELKKEMAKPRMARSAKIAKLNMDTARTVEPPSVTMPGTVNEIIVPPGPSRTEKAQIGIAVADPKYRDLRIENVLTDEHGDDVKLKKGAHVSVTVAADPVTSEDDT